MDLFCFVGMMTLKPNKQILVDFCLIGSQAGTLEQRRSNSLTSSFRFLFLASLSQLSLLQRFICLPFVWPAQKGNKDDKYVTVV